MALLDVAVTNLDQQRVLFSKLAELSDRLKTGELHLEFVERNLPCAGTSRHAGGPVTGITVAPDSATISGPQIYAGGVRVGLGETDFANGSSYSVTIAAAPIPELQHARVPLSEDDDVGDDV